jgi:hypothetical protein
VGSIDVVTSARQIRRSDTDSGLSKDVISDLISVIASKRSASQLE